MFDSGGCAVDGGGMMMRKVHNGTFFLRAQDVSPNSAII
jgi:hypothetical protein